jgi:hypothetical protein
MKENLRQIEWLNKEKQRDDLELEQQKIMLIENIKKYKKEDIIPKKQKPLSIWQRLKKVLIG